MSPDFNKALEAVISAAEKNFGKGAIMHLNTKVNAEPDAVVSTGSIALDSALGIGGYRKGRIIEVYGPESSGKTTLMLHAVAEAQKVGGVCAFIDAEHALDPIYAQKIGVNLETLLVSQPDSGEQALQIAAMLARSGEVKLIVIDSVAALVPQKELEGDVGDHHVGAQARMMSQAMRMLAGAVSNSGSIIMFTNQIRMKIGVMFGSPETTTGGNALKFYASQRLDIRRIGQIKDKSTDEYPTGIRAKVKVVKNKVAPPFKLAEFDVRFGVGIDKFAEAVDLGVEDGLIEKAGSWYSYNGTRIGQGRSNAIQFLKEDPKVFEKVKKELLELRGLVHEPVKETKEKKK